MTKAKDDREKSVETGEKFARIQTALQDPRCTRLMVSVLAALNEYANARRKAWPSFESLAFVTGAAIQNVKIAIKELEALGYITVDRDDTPGRSRVNYYHLQVPKCAAPIRALRDALEAHRNKVGEEKEARTHARIRQRPPTEKEARARLKEARAAVLTVILACPDPSDQSLPCDPCSDTTVSADAAAPASRPNTPPCSCKRSRGTAPIAAATRGSFTPVVRS